MLKVSKNYTFKELEEIKHNMYKEATFRYYILKLQKVKDKALLKADKEI